MQTSALIRVCENLRRTGRLHVMVPDEFLFSDFVAAIVYCDGQGIICDAAAGWKFAPQRAIFCIVLCSQRLYSSDHGMRGVQNLESTMVLISISVAGYGHECIGRSIIVDRVCYSSLYNFLRERVESVAIDV